MLFILVHQAYELWFKQILHEMDAVHADFSAQEIEEDRVAVAVSRLTRITEIQKILIDQLRVMETMTPLDFLDFRDVLTPASGFQSLQFRLIENKLGLAASRRVSFDSTPYFKRLSASDQKKALAAQNAASLFDLVEKWLERTPFLNFESFDFWKSYEFAVADMLDSDEDIIRTNPTLSPKQKKKQLEAHKITRASFGALLDKRKFEKIRKKGEWRLSQKATLSALLIQLYRDHPILHMPFRFLNLLVEVDENFAIWRHRHVIMVHRMIGRKIGTGGSSGTAYLAKTAAEYRVFSDLFNLSTFLIPRSKLPALPLSVRRELGFYFDAA
jgi:tryptophan 2,3-dioxygenase